MRRPPVAGSVGRQLGGDNTAAATATGTVGTFVPPWPDRDPPDAEVPSRTVRPRGAARREALLEATLRIVADTGADAVTHRRVAEVAQLPLASTTYYFDSKEQLLTAALELAAERDLARLHALADDRRRLPAEPR